MTWRYLPDLPADSPNTWRVCDGWFPDRNGIYRTGFLAASYSDYGAGAGYTAGKAYRTAAGTLGIVLLGYNGASNSAMVYNGTWNDRVGALTQLYSTPAGIAQVGNITLVAMHASGIASRDASGTSNFASISGAPTCSVLLVTPLNIVVALNALSSQNHAGSDAWYASDAGDYTNWSTGEYVTGNLRQTPGVLTAGVVFGNDVIAFKRRGVYRGSYVGGYEKWIWRLLTPSLGAWGPGCAVSAADKVYFYGDDGFYSYDGANFQKLDIGIAYTIAATIADPNGAFGYNADSYSAVKLVYDSLNRRVCIFNFGEVVIGNHVTNPRHFSYSIDSGAWGYQERVKDETDDSDDYSGIVDNAEEFNSFTDGAWTYNSNIALISSTNTDIRILTTEYTSANVGTNYKPKLRTHRIGSRVDMTSVNRLVPNWVTSDGAGTDLSGATLKSAIPYSSDSLIESETAGTAVTLSTDQYRADFTKSRRWHSVELQLNCEACIDGATWDSPKFSGRN
mgnify:CR=1 FL=1